MIESFLTWFIGPHYTAFLFMFPLIIATVFAVRAMAQLYKGLPK